MRTRSSRYPRILRRAPISRALSRAERGWFRAVEWLHGLDLDENTILLGFAVAVGLLGALGVVAFYWLIDLAFQVFFRWPATVLGSGDLLLYRPLFTALGLSLAWWIGERFSRGEEGPNVPTVQLAVARRNGDVPVGPGLGRTAASAVTLGVGGSAGSEGPVAVLGATAGSFLGGIFRFDSSRTKVMVAAGTAAGISAAFNAPLAGAFFALEEILGAFSVAAFPAVVVSSVVAAMVSRAAFGDHPAFPVPMEYGYTLGWEVFVLFPLLGVVAGLAAVLYIRAYFGVPELVRRLGIPRGVQPWIGGALVGLLVWLSGGVLVGYGHLAVRIELFGGLAWTTLALLAVGKIVATSITLGMGGTGGVFTPSLYIGAVTGGAYGVLVTDLFPSLGLRPEAYALVGMGVVVAAATSAPLTAIFIVFEMTNDYAIVLPLMMASVVGSLVARRMEPDSLYSGWLRRRGEHLEHGADRDVLARLRVEDAFDPNPQVVGEAATVDQMLQRLGPGEATEFPVVDEELRVVGVISVADLGRVARDSRELAEVLVAADLAVPAETVAPGDSLLVAVRRMGVRGTGILPVVEGATGRLRGVITRAHVLGVYARAVAEEPPARAPRGAR